MNTYVQAVGQNGSGPSLTDIHIYWVATISRLLKNIGLFSERALQKRLYAAKETIIVRSLLIVATLCTYIVKQSEVARTSILNV